jgi:hypothetical protein
MSEEVSLSSEEKELLLSVVRKRLPSLGWSVSAMGKTPLKPTQQEALKGLLMDEIRESGGASSERGAVLKKLLDRVGRL